MKVHEKYAIYHINTLIGVSIFSQFGKFFTPEGKQQFMVALPDKYKSHPAVVEEKRRMEVEVNTVEGKPFTDFEMPAPDGKNVKLSEFVAKSKLTLVDFWASWCVPCRKEIPAIKKIYADYKDKGLGLVGVSFDEHKGKWVQGITDLKLNYPQMSDLKGWESVGAKAYNIEAIPFTLLIAQDGTIVAKNLRGEELVKCIEEFFKK